MATILAAATGNWSATGTWTGGVVPQAGDIVVANGKTITMDTLNVTVAQLRNDTTGGAVAGGSFNLVSGSNVTANVFGGTTGSCVTWAGTTGQTATVTGNIAAGGGSNGINCTGGNLTIGGGAQVTGGTGSSTAVGIIFASAGTFTFATAGNPGTITGGTSTNSSAFGVSFPTANSVITIYATSIASPTTAGGSALNFSANNQTASVTATNIGVSAGTQIPIYANGISANHTYTISGNITGGTASSCFGIHVLQSGTYNITVAGNISAGTGNSAAGLLNGSTATINLTGNFTNTVGSINGTNYSITNNSTGTINVTGALTAGNTQTTGQNTTTGIFRCTRAKGNGYGAGSVGLGNTIALVSGAQGSLTYVEEIEFGALGQPPTTGVIRLTSLTTNKAIFTTTTGTTKTLSDPADTSGLVPAVTDVRTGVVYSSGNLTGTCAVPAAGSVALGVPVDNTTGTAVLTAADARTALGLASANLDTQLSGISTSVSALPSAATIATAVWAAATRTLTTAIDNSATIAAAVWSYATGRTITGGTVDTLTNAPTVPSAAAIASQVRTELTTELGRIDASVSSRLAASSYTTPPTAAANATAVRTELATELARMANAATVDTTGQQIQDAVTN